jgi:hypothetical protein
MADSFICGMERLARRGFCCLSISGLLFYVRGRRVPPSERDNELIKE